jgi:hypothetical protein
LNWPGVAGKAYWVVPVIRPEQPFFCMDKNYAAHFTSCMYNKAMLIEYDPVKDQINQEKHGVSLA